jgi:hypothetical protein
VAVQAERGAMMGELRGDRIKCRGTPGVEVKKGKIHRKPRKVNNVIKEANYIIVLDG